MTGGGEKIGPLSARGGAQEGSEVRGPSRELPGGGRQETIQYASGAKKFETFNKIGEKVREDLWLPKEVDQDGQEQITRITKRYEGGNLVATDMDTFPILEKRQGSSGIEVVTSYEIQGQGERSPRFFVTKQSVYEPVEDDNGEVRLQHTQSFYYRPHDDDTVRVDVAYFGENGAVEREDQSRVVSLREAHTIQDAARDKTNPDIRTDAAALARILGQPASTVGHPIFSGSRVSGKK
jgi:hypothetical protein